MSTTSFFEEITGEKHVPVCYETEQNKVKELIRTAKKNNCHGVETFSISSDARYWLESEGFTVDREKEIFYKCCNNDEFNHCECYVCRNAGEETGSHVWKISWPKNAKK